MSTTLPSSSSQREMVKGKTHQKKDGRAGQGTGVARLW